MRKRYIVRTIHRERAAALLLLMCGANPIRSPLPALREEMKQVIIIREASRGIDNSLDGYAEER